MKPIFILTTLSFAFTLAAVPSAWADGPPQNPAVHIKYVKPAFMTLYEQFTKRGVLEEYSRFLSPLRLKKPLTVSIEECGVINSDYNFEQHHIRICYEWLNMLENGAALPQEKQPEPYNDPKEYPGVGLMPGFTKAEAIVGGTLQVLLHETGHAVFDLQGIPRLGREEDAADEISGLIMLQFGTTVARTAVKGAINTFHYLEARYGGTPAADVHSANAQRAINYLCLAYGRNSAEFEDLAPFIPDARKSNCKYEYQQALLAFKKTVMPFVDEGLLEKVRAMPILRPDDAKL